MHENALYDTLILPLDWCMAIIVSDNAFSCIISIYVYICLCENIISSDVFSATPIKFIGLAA